MRWMPVLAAVIPMILVGCGGEKPAEVSGTVFMDGQPLKEGEIIFEATDNSKTPAGGMIANGKYTILVLPGPKRVKVLASRPTSIPDPVMGSAAREAIIGPEFNERTTLTTDVKPGKQAGVDFTVKSLPPFRN